MVTERAVHGPAKGMLAGRAVFGRFGSSQAGLFKGAAKVPVVDSAQTELCAQLVQGHQYTVVDQTEGVAALVFIDGRGHQLIDFEKPGSVHSVVRRQGLNRPHGPFLDANGLTAQFKVFHHCLLPLSGR